MPRKKIFVDTSAWYAFIDRNDRDHSAAVNKVQGLDRFLLTSNYVFDEILTLRPHDSEELRGYPFLRNDSGEYRIIYDVQGDTLRLILVGKRSDAEVYRQL